MRKRPETLGFLAMSLALVLMLSASITGRAAPDDGDITFVIEADHVVLLTDDMSVAISTLFPAAAVKETEALDNSSYGFVFSSILGYNESDVYGLVLDEVPYHASMEHATWTSETPIIVDEGDGTSTAYVSMHSLVDMNKRIAFEDGNPDPGTPGIEIIEGWAAVTVDFIISSSNFSSTFNGATDEGLYPVNGSTELKFDITIDINIPIDADHLALDIGLMMMDFGNFTPTAMDEQYIFEGFQSDEVSISDPYENETTEDDELIMHSFQHRDKLKQLFAFNDTDESSFFSWASGCMTHNLTAGDTFEDLLTYYRTDGEALKVYISAPITPETAQITHDPSLGVFPASRGGIIELPDGSIIGSSAMSTALGILIGAVVAGGTGVAVAVRRSASQDQSETVVLEKNRYYRGK